MVPAQAHVLHSFLSQQWQVLDTDLKPFLVGGTEGGEYVEIQQAHFQVISTALI